MENSTLLVLAILGLSRLLRARHVFTWALTCPCRRSATRWRRRLSSELLTTVAKLSWRSMANCRVACPRRFKSFPKRYECAAILEIEARAVLRRKLYV